MPFMKPSAGTRTHKLTQEEEEQLLKEMVEDDVAEEAEAEQLLKDLAKAEGGGRR